MSFERQKASGVQSGIALEGDGYASSDAQVCGAVPESSAAIAASTSMRLAQRNGDGQYPRGIQYPVAVPEISSASAQAISHVAPALEGDGYAPADIQSPGVVPEPSAAKSGTESSEATQWNGDGGDHFARETHPSTVASDPNIPLRLAADTLNDIEDLRKAVANRIRALSEIPGWNVTPAALRWKNHESSLMALEADVVKELERTMKMHPLGPWVKRTTGVGEKQAGRLIGAIGDPSWNSLEERPRRGPAELWAFCGYVPGQRRRKGEKSNWNAAAKMRAFLVAENAVKAGVRKLDECDDTDGYDLEHRKAITPLGAVYLAARAKHAGAVHPEPCAQCGPKGKPAQEGSPLSSGHQHARALREVAKAVLRDLWVESMRLRNGDQSPTDSHCALVAAP